MKDQVIVQHVIWTDPQDDDGDGCLRFFVSKDREHAMEEYNSMGPGYVTDPTDDTGFGTDDDTYLAPVTITIAGGVVTAVLGNIETIEATPPANEDDTDEDSEEEGEEGS